MGPQVPHERAAERDGHQHLAAGSQDRGWHESHGCCGPSQAEESRNTYSSVGSCVPKSHGVDSVLQVRWLRTWKRTSAMANCFELDEVHMKAKVAGCYILPPFQNR